MYPPRDEIIAALVAHLRNGTRTVEELANFIGVTLEEVNTCLDQIRPVIDDDAAIAYELEGFEWEEPQPGIAYVRLLDRRLNLKLAQEAAQGPLPKIVLSAPPTPSRPKVAGPRQLAKATSSKVEAPKALPMATKPAPQKPLTDDQLNVCLTAAVAALQERAGFLGRVQTLTDANIKYLHGVLHRIPGLNISLQQVQRQVVGKLVDRKLLWVCPPEQGDCWHLRGAAISS